LTPTRKFTASIAFQHGRILFSARIGEVGPLKLLLDSACTIPTLRPEVMDELKLTPSGRVRINGIAGIERAPTYRGVVFELGGAAYSPRRVAVLPSERQERRRRDGVLDSGFFTRYVLEVLAREKSVRLHSPTNFSYDGPGEIVSFHFREEIPVLSASIVLPDHDPIPVELELDTGCDSGLCLGDHFVKKHDIVALIEGRSSEKFGIGGSVETKSVRVPAIRIGKIDLKNVDTDLFLDGSPVDEPLAGHIGMAALGQHKIILDYHRKRLIIE
jgi:hypothetical protein